MSGDMKDVFDAHKEFSKQKRIEKTPVRIQAAINALSKTNYKFSYHDKDSFNIDKNGNRVHFWPYSGWYQGAGIKGRVLQSLLKKLKSL